MVINTFIYLYIHRLVIKDGIKRTRMTNLVARALNQKDITETL